ncbi:hypothetical protein [Acinetobacter indicus]|uniref:hypothetical protein n=1 Tax=Acinetobacter indicus TaxID=756892 RepID=UPI001443986A|nr:hypothetical protein [Acinetobacter indicus]
MDTLRIKYQAIIQQKLKNNELNIFEITNEASKRIFTIEPQEVLLNQIEIFSIKESFVLCK